MKLSDILMDGFQPEESDPINVKTILSRYLRYWYLFLAGLVICIGVAFYYLYSTTPLYSISSTLLIKDSNKGSDFSKNAVYSDLENYQSIKNIENEIEILSSVSLMRSVVAELGLHTSYFTEEGFSKKKEIYGKEVPVKVVIHRYDSLGYSENPSIRLHLKGEKGFELETPDGKRSNHQFGEKLENFYGVFSVERASSWSAQDPQTIIVTFNHLNGLAVNYSSRLNIEITKKLASVLSIEMLEAVPQKGINIINKLVEVYNKEAVNDKNLIAANTIKFIDDQLEVLTAELAEVEEKVEDYKQQNQISADVIDEALLYLSNTKDYEKQLAQYSIQMQVVESIENYLIDQKEDYQMIPSSLTLDDDALVALINRFNDLQRERERMLRTTQPNNPFVLNLNEQLANLRRDILENLNNIKNGIQIAMSNLESSSNQSAFKSQKVPEIERELLEIGRQQSIKEEHYLYLVKKREESALSLAATTVSNSRIVDPAMASFGPVKPNPLMVYAFAVVFGLGFPFAFVFAKTMLNERIQERREVERKTTVPILGEISHNKGGFLAITNQSRTLIAEQFRLIRTNLQFATKNGQNSVILVTSSLGGEGKTFFSTNFGSSLSLADKKVVILEFDLRKPALLKSLGMRNDIGISEFLKSTDMSVDEIIKSSEASPGLYVIGCGAIPIDPAELMMNKRVGLLIDQLRQNFDHVILDTAPVGQVADAYNLAPYTDRLVYIMRYNFTSKSHIDIIKDIDKKNKFKNPMIVLNDANVKTSYGYGYGYDYGYGYSYDSSKTVKS